MSRSLYSLILTDEVVNEIDREAARNNTNRSNLVNQILAEYVSYLTPEKRIDGIFKQIEQMLLLDRDIIPNIIPNQLSMSMKSSLEYKYRPTIRYEVQLYRNPEEAIGELSVVFRTQSQALLETLTMFFRIWKQLEDIYISPAFTPGAHEYGLYEGKFVRTISVPKNRDYSSEELGKEIAEYVRMFDSLMKAYISGRLDAPALEREYVLSLKKSSGLI